MAPPNKHVNLVSLIAVAIFSLVAMILVFVTDFGWQWYGTGYSTYYFWLGNSNIAAWPQIFLVVIGIIFLISLGYSIILLLINLEKLSLKISGRMQAVIGIGISIIAFVATLFTVGMWAIASIDYWDWGVDTTFYTSLFGSIVIGIFYSIYFVNSGKMQKEQPEK